MHIVLALIVTLALVAANTLPFTKCGDGIFTINSVDASPYPLVPGGTTNIVVNGSLSAQFNSGTYTIAVLSGATQLYSKSGDLCSLSSKFTCPHQAGPVELTQDFAVPSYAPSGDYTVKISAVQGDNTAAFCFTFPISIQANKKETTPFPSNSLSPVPYTKCADGILEITSIEADPFPLKSGVPITVTAKGTLAKDFAAGNYNIKVKLGGLQIYSKSGDFCSLDKSICPQKAGPLAFTKSFTIPRTVPAGHYNIEATITNPDGSVAACYNLDLSLKFSLNSVVSKPKVIAPPQNALQVFSPVPYSKCAEGMLEITSLEADPFPLQSGIPITVTAKANLAKDFAAGNYDIKVNLGGLQIFSKSGDLCALDKSICPQKAGPVTFTKSFTIPSIAPSGQYSVEAHITSPSNEVVACYNINLSLNAVTKQIEIL
jgi:hypothetical protein